MPQWIHMQWILIGVMWLYSHRNAFSLMCLWVTILVPKTLRSILATTAYKRFLLTVCPCVAERVVLFVKRFIYYSLNLIVQRIIRHVTMVTFIGFLSCVTLHMLYVMFFLQERLITIVTLVRLLPSVILKLYDKAFLW